MKPFLTNKGHLENAEIMLIQDKKIISNENKRVKEPTNIAKSHSIDNNRQAVELICNSYRNHLSILKIKSNIKTKVNVNNKTIFSPVSRKTVPTTEPKERYRR